MASTLILSKAGLEIIDRARKLKGWNKAGVAWQVQAEVAKSTLDRFWMQKPIKQQNFVAICAAVGVSDWEQIADLPPIASVPARRGSNLGQVHEPAILELDGFAQQVFGWFQALGFDRESDPRRDGNYVKWVIKVVMRSRVDRVLIKAIIHEVGLGDLDGLRRSVADLRVDEGWLVTSLWVSPAVKQVLNKSEEGLTCLTFDELIDQDANFAPYVAWLEAEVRRRELEKYYVLLGCTKGEFDGISKTLRGVNSYPVSDGGIDLYIDRWLENPLTEHVSILGEFGTGKTWFVLHYAWRCLQAYVEAKRNGLPRPRLPLVIPLRDYAKALNVENVLAGFFYTQHNIRLNSAVFDRLNQMGKLLLIFDGFDEMADKVDHQKMIDNFWELAKVVTPNAKVILTCRTEHFPTAQVGRDTLRGELLASTARLTGVPPQFETLELMKFDDVQIREVLGRRTNEVTVEKVMGHGQVLDLLRRAVMAEFVLAALPEIEAGAEIDLARVYLYAVRRQMEENITTGRTFTSLADKLYFLCELSWEMLSTDRMSLNYREFPDLLKRFFGAEVESPKDLDHWHYDMMGQTMLVRNDDGDYSPAHRSLLEFFVAYKFAAELGLLAPDFLSIAQNNLVVDEVNPKFYTWSSYWRRDKDSNRKPLSKLAGFTLESTEKMLNTFGKNPLARTKVIADLVVLISKDIIEWTEKYQSLYSLIEITKGKSVKETRYLGGNAGTILLRLNSDALIDKDLSSTNLSHIDLTNAKSKRTDLRGANLNGCIVSNVLSPINYIVVSTNDQRFITAHDDNSIRVWDRASCRVLQRLVGHKGFVDCLTMSEDSKTIYSGSDDGFIKEWNLDDGICKRTFHAHQDSVMTIVLSKDNRFLYSGGDDGLIKKWDLDDGICKRTFHAHQDSVRIIILSKNDQLLYSGGDDGFIKEWNLDDGICKRTFHAHQDSVMTIVLSKDNRLLYSGGSDSSIKEWDLNEGMCKQIFRKHQSLVRVLALSRNQNLLYSSSDDGTINEWELSSSICKHTFSGHDSWIKTIALSNDGKSLYSGDNNGILKEWELSSHLCKQTFSGYQSCIRTLVPSKDGLLLYSGGDGSIKQWNVDNGICQQTFNGHQSWVRTIILSVDERLIYSCGRDNQIKEWKIDDGSCSKTFKGHKDLVNVLVLSPDGKFLYSGSRDRTIKKWEIDNEICHHTFKGHQSWVRSIVLSNDGLMMYSGSNDNTIKEWSLVDCSYQRTFTGHKKLVSSIILSKNGEWLYSASHDSMIKIWRLSDGICYQTLDGHQAWVSSIILSKDGEWLYSASHDHTIKIWRLSDGVCCQTLEGHRSSVMAIALRDNGEFLYSGSTDGVIKVWDVTKKQCVTTIDPRPCAGADITNVKGLTPAQIDALIALGAFDDNRKA